MSEVSIRTPFYGWLFVISSYDGENFYDQADSNYGHFATSLAMIDEAPLAVGGYKNQKAETFDISANTWTEVEDYPYHD